MVIVEVKESLEQKLGGDNGELTERGIQTRAKYVLIANTIRQRIIDGDYEPLQKLSRAKFVEEFQVNPATMAQALKILRGEGYIIGNNNYMYACSGEPDSNEKPITELHEIIAHKIREQIKDGLYKPGERMPSIKDLEFDDELGGSRVTVVRALDTLKQEGLLVSKKGSGIFVNPNYANATTQYSK